MKIFVWSDYACSFCWIGEARLRKAIDGLHMDAVMMPRAFELNPAASKTTNRYGLETIATGYGMSLKQAKAEFDKIAAMAREDGIELRQDHTQHTNTFDAHCLMKLGLSAADRTLAEKLNELLFAAFFVDNLNLADHKILIEAGMKAGLSEMKIGEML